MVRVPSRRSTAGFGLAHLLPPGEQFELHQLRHIVIGVTLVLETVCAATADKLLFRIRVTKGRLETWNRLLLILPEILHNPNMDAFVRD